MGQERKATEVVVAGGGAIGCAVARRAALRGAAVTVVEPGEPGARATRAAGGMLSPLGESDAPGPFLRLGVESLRRYPGFVEEVETASGRSVGLQASGKLKVALGDARMAALSERARWLEDAGFEARLLEADEVRDREPALTDTLRGGLLLEGELQVDNRRLGPALREAAEAAGARFVLGRSVAAVESGEGSVRGVRLDDGGRVSAPRVVVCAGAWSGTIAGLPRRLPVRPVRGQMLALATGGAFLDAMVETERAYLIPRAGGPLIVGSSQEEAGFDARTTAEAVRRLLDAALEALPLAADSPLEEAWAGLRPGTPDDLPILGPDPDVEGLFYATGHFRNGILLTPVTAVLVDAWLAGDAPPLPADDLRAFRPDRF